jgi:hypothetical protein
LGVADDLLANANGVCDVAWTISWNTRNAAVCWLILERVLGAKQAALGAAFPGGGENHTSAELFLPSEYSLLIRLSEWDRRRRRRRSRRSRRRRGRSRSRSRSSRRRSGRSSRSGRTRSSGKFYWGEPRN